jgi:hypothetical protein
MGRQTSIESSLRRLQSLVRQEQRETDEPTVMTKQIPGVLRGEREEYLSLRRDERDALASAKETLLGDLRFEYMAKEADDALWQFVCKAFIDRRTDHVPGFVGAHAREPLDLVCYVPVLSLTVEDETTVLGLLLLPANDPRVPKPHGSPSLDPDARSVAAVDVRGTNYAETAARAQARASHALRVLRVALRDHPWINQAQLRFRIGRTYAFDDRLAGWRQWPHAAYELDLNDELLKSVEEHPVSRLGVTPANDIERRVDIALRWMERAWLAGEPLIDLLYLFFALEALLGDKSEGLKGQGLAFRQAMLTHAVTGGFEHPNKTLFLYGEVRSAAVHGSAPPEVDEQTVRGVRWSLCRTLKQYLEYAEAEGITRRADLLKRPRTHPDHQALVDWLRTNGGPTWREFLNKVAAS